MTKIWIAIAALFIAALTLVAGTHPAHAESFEASVSAEVMWPSSCQSSYTNVYAGAYHAVDAICWTFDWNDGWMAQAWCTKTTTTIGAIWVNGAWVDSGRSKANCPPAFPIAAGKRVVGCETCVP